ncbi:DNA cross-link repair 1A protein [Ochotona princeps]|uniref:DNA cross-link repair 1A protein n=1 Tax=Ochotona princeps TaxID=9978 RepID=UPI0027155696|nr:DNA cross-link repair 1A protein [Ochotona princeps]XP_058527611.1 DNA cross-link repair 1A protein [Ochotona princeps]
MLEDTSSEEDIWEYKSKRKPKQVHPNDCSENSLKSTEEATDGKDQAKQNRNKKGTRGAPGKKRGGARNPGVPGWETCATCSQEARGGGDEDGIPQSQDKQSTPRKRCRTPQSKQVSPKIRPVYSGYCPNCQMPFSSLLGQTPRWHVFECLDSPPASETECPEGLLCTSTIPSHYKRYTHFLLAQSRASRSPPSSPSHGADGSFRETNSGVLCRLEERLCQKQSGNLKSVSDDPLVMTQSLKKSQSPTETKGKIYYENAQKPQQVLQFTEAVKTNTLVGDALPLEDEMLDSQNDSKHLNLPLPEDDCSNCEISYSPLQSDEDTYDMDEKLDDSQQELFFTESSKDGSLEEEDSSLASFGKLRGPILQDQEDSFPTGGSFLTQNRYNGELYRSSVPNSSSQLISPNNESIISHDGSASHDSLTQLFPPALTEELAASNYQATKKTPRKPEFHSTDKQKEVIDKSAVHNQVSPAKLQRKDSKPSRNQEGDNLPLDPRQSRARALSGETLGAENNPKSECLCRKALDRMPGSKVTALTTETAPSTPPAAKSFKISPSSSKCDARQPTKAMKQMDIGVYFGLPPKKQEEKSPKKQALDVEDLNQAQNHSGRKSRQCKRKAEKSLSDLEFDTKNLSESPLPVELPRSQRQRKRLRKSSSQQEGGHQKGSDHSVSNTPSRKVNLSKGEVVIRSARGGPLRRNLDVSESFDARKKKCPFYKKIPGTTFTVDAFQYGTVEGCSAYFLTHFHSDHYAGLSKNSTFPVYCSEITGNLLKNKLHVQEHYIHTLPMDTECVVNGVKVVLLDANHCPGATMILFHLPNGTVMLHTGDFRADPSMERSPLLAGQKVHTLYLDTTYCSPEYTFPSQQEVIQFAISTAFEAVTLNPRVLVVCGTYSIGKEKVFLAIADVLGSKVGMSQEKYKTLQCLKSPEINSLITTDMCSSLVHVLPMMQINFKGLQSHLKKFGEKYDEILAFRPTGWTHSNKLTRITDVIPQIKGNISIYGIPYSEHSSYLEMKRFVQWLKPQKIIPTVNVGSWKSRRTMEQYFKEWKLEAGY